MNKHEGQDSTHECSTHPGSFLTQTLAELSCERGLWSAVRDGDEQKVASLISRKADVNERDSYGYSLLHYATKNANICKLLLERGANPNGETKFGKVRPIHRAAYAGHAKVIQYLSEFGADVNAQDADNSTSLHKAAQQGHLDTVATLLMHGADPTVRDVRGNTAADLAKNDQIRKMLEKKN
ncbi:ankyrin repeat domain-containing protein 39-like [Schistocerca gregaria]|uniref:ankyrin repeat domain-containing protein 39-like n=1 Tax=Schistocerca gregaria TaxID=7010 RepID=UPI00211DB410|nr:ankyrin repeat domain-containing protein 39-like [Schistocerca gregaria]